MCRHSNPAWCNSNFCSWVCQIQPFHACWRIHFFRISNSFSNSFQKKDCFTDRYGHKTHLDWVDFAPNNTAVSRIQLKKSNIWRHINYNHSTRENDIALVFLDNKVDIQPVRLNDKPGFPLISGSSLNVTGWGPKNLDGLFPNRQQTVTEVYATNAKCNYPGLTPDKLCTTVISDEFSDRCIGDSVST